MSSLDYCFGLIVFLERLRRIAAVMSWIRFGCNSHRQRCQRIVPSLARRLFSPRLLPTCYLLCFESSCYHRCKQSFGSLSSLSSLFLIGLSMVLHHVITRSKWYPMTKCRIWLSNSFSIEFGGPCKWDYRRKYVMPLLDP